MLGMNRYTGKPLTGSQHIIQSIHDILSTPTGMRVMLRDYGSDLFELVDKPLNQLLELELKAQTVGAIEKWEPRVRITGVEIQKQNDQGKVTIAVEGHLLADGNTFRLEGIAL